MKLKDLERMVSHAVTGRSRPTLEEVARSTAGEAAVDGEFANAIRTLSSRAGMRRVRGDDPTRWS